MHRYTRFSFTLLMSAGLAGGSVGMVNAAQPSAQYRLVQQSAQQGDQGRTDQAADQAGGAAQRSGEQAGDAAQRARGQASQAMQGAGATAGQYVPGQLPAGFSVKHFDGVHDNIRETLKNLTGSALNRDKFDDLTDNLVRADRDRLKPEKGQAQTVGNLNQVIDQVNRQWRTKYNQDLKVDENAFSDEFLAVTTGEVTNPESVQNWPLSLTSRGGKQYGKAAMNRGTDIAVATISIQPKNPVYHVSMIREGGDWKIDVPDTLTADRLRANLSRHLSQLSSMQNQWPDDAAQAQRLASSHILMALYDVDQQQGGGARGQQGQQQQEQPQQQDQQRPQRQEGQQSPQNQQQGQQQSQQPQQGQPGPQGQQEQPQGQ